MAFADHVQKATALVGRRFADGLEASAVVVAAIVVLISLPLLSVLLIAIGPAESIWPHLLRNVLPQSIVTTLLLLAGTGLLALVTGAGAAWIVTMYVFPGRGLIDRLLVLPLAMPTYIVAYCYVDLLDYTGAAQTTLRAVFGWTSARDYWFPDVRSLGGAIVILATVLYPYVYRSARASFVQQSVCALEVARTLGRTPVGTLWSVALPLARPALAAGVALVMMECLNDLGAVQYLGVETLSASIYSTWLQRSSLAGAAQIAIVMLVFVAALIFAERRARGDAKVHHTTGRYRSIPFHELTGLKGYVTAFIAMIPFVIGFIIPFSVLARHTWHHWHHVASETFLRASVNSLVLASLAGVTCVGVALILAHADRVTRHPLMSLAVRFTGLGYALPGTVLAIGLMTPLAVFDNRLDALMRSVFGISTGLLLSGSIAAMSLAYVVRFLAVALGAVESGFQRISPNLDSAARALGETAASTLWRVHVPLLVPAMGAAGLLVFVDTMKELPATLLMRPFNFETLATHVYGFAGLEQFEMAAPGALAIVIAGLVPVLLLHSAVAGGRAGGGSSGRTRRRI